VACETDPSRSGAARWPMVAGGVLPAVGKVKRSPGRYMCRETARVPNPIRDRSRTRV